MGEPSDDDVPATCADPHCGHIDCDIVRDAVDLGADDPASDEDGADINDPDYRYSSDAGYEEGYDYPHNGTDSSS